MMTYAIGVVFLLISIWQIFITWRTISKLKLAAGKETSPFILLGIASSLIFAVIFFTVAIRFLFFSGF